VPRRCHPHRSGMASGRVSAPRAPTRPCSDTAWPGGRSLTRTAAGSRAALSIRRAGVGPKWTKPNRGCISVVGRLSRISRRSTLGPAASFRLPCWLKRASGAACPSALWAGASRPSSRTPPATRYRARKKAPVSIRRTRTPCSRGYRRTDTADRSRPWSMRTPCEAA